VWVCVFVWVWVSVCVDGCVDVSVLGVFILLNMLHHPELILHDTI